MSLKIYNTLTRKKDEFKPLKKGVVKMYVCGPTVYDYCHLGHGRAYVAFDIIYRYLKYKGYKVTYIRNITDIDDKIIKRANEISDPGKTLEQKVIGLTEKYIKMFHEDMDMLNLEKLQLKQEPRATQYIPNMIELINKLLKKQLAYAAGGNVYYKVSAFKEYGKLSNRNIEELLSGARVESDPGKENPLDFSLWKEAKPNEPSWDSPWGKGRPGWHMECSSMSLSLLGEVFDIHGGGQDLIFPHHENEIAQSCGCTGKQPVRYWIHNGFVTINKEKMSKSLGNFFTLKDIFSKYNPIVVRFFLLSQHYSSPVDFSDQVLEDAKHAFNRIENCLRRTQIYLDQRGNYKKDNSVHKEIAKKFEEVMDDDFNTAKALAVIFDTVSLLNRDMINEVEPSKIYKICNTIKILSCDILGLVYGLAKDEQKTIEVFVGKDSKIELKESELKKKISEHIDEKTCEELLKARNYYRKVKRWDLADEIRKHLADSGFSLQDTKDGTICH